MHLCEHVPVILGWLLHAIQCVIASGYCEQLMAKLACVPACVCSLACGHALCLYVFVCLGVCLCLACRVCKLANANTASPTHGLDFAHGWPEIMNSGTAWGHLMFARCGDVGPLQSTMSTLMNGSP